MCDAIIVVRARCLSRIAFLLLLLQLCIGYNETQASDLEKNQLNNTFHGKTINSGPIYLIDKRTIFVSLFRYSHNGFDNVHKRSRWLKLLADDGRTQELEELFFVYYSTNMEAQLAPAELSIDYHRQNVYLRIGGESQRDVSQFRSLVIVNRVDDIEVAVDIVSADEFDLPDALHNPLFKNGKYEFRYPKCCPPGTYAGSDDCTPMNKEPISRVSVHLVQGCDFNNESLKNIEYVPFPYRPECDEMYFLDSTDERYMLIDGRLISPLPDFACIDFIETDGGLVEELFMCPYNTVNVELGNRFYVGLMYFSSALLLLWAAVVTTMIAKEMFPQSSSRTIVVQSVIYSVFYAMHFIILATAREIGVVNDTCKILGYVYQFLLLSSFMAMFGLIFEGFYRVGHYNKPHSKNRMFFYFGFGAVPLITTLASIFTNELTSSTETQKQRDSACWFRSDRKVYSYYVPIICIIICCMMIQLMTYFNIRENLRTDRAVFGIEASKFKNIFRLGAYLNGIMTFCWGLEVIAYYFEAQNNFWFVVDAFNSVQGFAIFSAFSYHYFDEVWKKLFTCTMKATAPRRSQENGTQMQKLMTSKPT